MVTMHVKSTATINDSQSTSTNQSGNEKTLVVYYSASGNTKDVAEKIAKITEADLFEIEPVEPYTDCLLYTSPLISTVDTERLHRSLHQWQKK